MYFSSTILFCFILFYFGISRCTKKVSPPPRKDIFPLDVSFPKILVLIHLHSHSSKAKVRLRHNLCLVIQTRHMNISEFIFPPGFIDLASSHLKSYECLVAFPLLKPLLGPGWNVPWYLAWCHVGIDFLIYLLTYIMPLRHEKTEHLFIKLSSRFQIP